MREIYSPGKLPIMQSGLNCLIKVFLKAWVVKFLMKVSWPIRAQLDLLSDEDLCPEWQGKDMSYQKLNLTNKTMQAVNCILEKTCKRREIMNPI